MASSTINVVQTIADSRYCFVMAISFCFASLNNENRPGTPLRNQPHVQVPPRGQSTMLKRLSATHTLWNHGAYQARLFPSLSFDTLAV